MTPEQITAMQALGAPRYSLFFLMKLKSGALVRAWLGVGDFEVPPDQVDTAGGVYPGIGMVGDIPPLSRLVNGLGERLEFRMDGANADVLALADEEAADVRGALVYVGIVFFDALWAAGPVEWLWEGTADVPAVDRSAGQRGISLSVASGFTDRTRPQLAFYTPADQKRRSPTDTFCDRVPLYTQESTITWPAPG